MASVRIQLADVVPQLEVRGGHRVIVLADGANEAVLELPDREPTGPAQRLAMAADRLVDEVRAAARGDYHRGGRIIAARGSQS